MLLLIVRNPRPRVDREIEELLREGWRKGRSAGTEIHKVEESYAAALRAETRWAKCIARLSSFASFTFCALNVSGTGTEAEHRFLETLKEYGQTWYEYTRKKCEALDRYVIEHHGMLTNADLSRFKLDASDYPKFGGLVEIPHNGAASLLEAGIVRSRLFLCVWNIFSP